MKLFYAHYPSLETAFLRYVRAERTNRLEPWLVVCASSFLAQRLSSQLARENGAVANFHFVTASSLLHTLDAQAGPAPTVFPQDHLRDFLLKEILSEPGMDRYPFSRGFAQALKASLRDLSDSLADPNVLEEHLQTTADPVLEQEEERLSWLIRLYRRYLEREAQVPGYRSYQDFFNRALLQIENSSYLKKFKQIIWYGFYDMSGRQLELVKQLQAYYALTVFAPYTSLPAYRFAKKFFETNWLGGADATCVQEPDLSVLAPCEKYLFAPQGSAPVQQVKIVPAADPSGEVFFVAKEILNLVEKQGFKFEDIAVIARTTESYQEEVRRVFAQNCIALNASFNYPLTKFSLGIFCLNLFSLAINGFDRDTVLSILDSSYFKSSQKQKWRALASRSLASRDLNQWRDLLPITEGFDPAFLTWLENCQTQLTDLATPRAWADSAAQALRFLKDNVDEAVLRGKELEVFESICSCITSLGDYSSIRAVSKPGEFIHELLDGLNSLSFHEADTARLGVTFTDVQRARGLSFKVVFVLGMMEKSFPMLQPEDPILRDRYRYILRDILGFWISQQAERTDEERLLFFITVTAAREQLYLCYSHVEQGGKEAVPSVYLAELARAGELDWKANQTVQISGRIGERICSAPAEFLTPKEISYACILTPGTALDCYRSAGLLTAQKERALHAAPALGKLGELTSQDGVIKSGTEIFNRLEKGAGFSPSALEELAACPMKFFFHRGLGLEEKEETFSRQELAPNQRGTAYHEVLQDFYQNLLRLELTHQLFDQGVANYIKEALHKRYTVNSGRAFGIYPLVWELILEQMCEQLTVFAQEDLKQLGNYTPSFFEKEFSRVRVDTVPFTLRGIIDRIDINKQDKTFKVADYKSSKKGGNNLGKAFFTHLIFQPYLYVLAAQTLPELKGYHAAGSCLLSIRKGYCRRDMTWTDWESLYPAIEKFFTLLEQLVKKGQFFLNTSDLCTYCPYRSICRRDNFASLMRARKSVPSCQLEELRNAES